MRVTCRCLMRRFLPALHRHGHGVQRGQLVLCNFVRIIVSDQSIVIVAQVLPFHGEVVICHGQKARSVGAERSRSGSVQVLQEKVERALGMLQRCMVSPQLRQGGTNIQMRSCRRVFGRTRQALESSHLDVDLQRLVQVLQRRVQLVPPPVEAAQVVVRRRAAAVVYVLSYLNFNRICLHRFR